MVTFNEMHEHQRKNLLEVVASNIDDATIGVRKTATTVLAELWFRIGHRSAACHAQPWFFAGRLLPAPYCVAYAVDADGAWRAAPPPFRPPPAGSAT